MKQSLICLCVLFKDNCTLMLTWEKTDCRYRREMSVCTKRCNDLATQVEQARNRVWAEAQKSIVDIDHVEALVHCFGKVKIPEEKNKVAIPHVHFSARPAWDLILQVDACTKNIRKTHEICGYARWTALEKPSCMFLVCSQTVC
jgi:hypothetical protein